MLSDKHQRGVLNHVAGRAWAHIGGCGRLELGHARGGRPARLVKQRLARLLAARASALCVEAAGAGPDWLAIRVPTEQVLAVSKAPLSDGVHQ